MFLGDITHLFAGSQFRGKIPDLGNTGILAVQMKNVSKNEGINWGDCIETELPSSKTKGLLNVGDILFTARGVNNYAVIVDNIPQNKVAIASPHFYVITVTKKDLIPEYLLWLLNQKPSQKYFQREQEGSLTKSIRRNVLEKMPITIPSLQKQKSIILLDNTLKQEQHILKQLIHNGEISMNAIANDLFASDSTNKKVTEKN